MAIATGGCGFLHPASGPVIADRPGYTDTPAVLPARGIQLEAGVTDDQTDGVTYRSVGETLLRYGVGHRAELRFFANSYGIRTTRGESASRGLEDTKAGVKVALHAPPDSVHGAMPRLALLVATTLPTGAANRTTHRAQPDIKLAASWTTSGPLSLYSNLGYGALYDGNKWGVRGWGSLAVWWAANPRVSLFAEGVAVGRVSGTAASFGDIDGGLTYLFNARVQADIRFGHGLGNAAGHEHFVGLGAAWRW